MEGKLEYKCNKSSESLKVSEPEGNSALVRFNMEYCMIFAKKVDWDLNTGMRFILWSFYDHYKEWYIYVIISEFEIAKKNHCDEDIFEHCYSLKLRSIILFEVLYSSGKTEKQSALTVIATIRLGQDTPFSKTMLFFTPHLLRNNWEFISKFTL